MAEKWAEFYKWLRQVDADTQAAVESAMDMESDLDEWLLQVDADTQAAVESAMDVEEDLVAFKQEVAAQTVAAAHRTGNDALDRAMRSVVADVEIADRRRRVDADVRLRWSRHHADLTSAVSGDGAPDGQRTRTAHHRTPKGQQGARDDLVAAALLYPGSAGWRTARMLTLGAYAAVGFILALTFAQTQVAVAATFLLGSLVTSLGIVARLAWPIADTSGVFKLVAERRASHPDSGQKPPRPEHRNQLETTQQSAR